MAEYYDITCRCDIGGQFVPDMKQRDSGVGNLKSGQAGQILSGHLPDVDVPSDSRDGREGLKFPKHIGSPDITCVQDSLDFGEGDSDTWVELAVCVRNQPHKVCRASVT